MQPHRLPFPHADDGFFSSTSNESGSNETIRNGKMLALNDTQKAHNVTSLWVGNYGNFTIGDSKPGDMVIEEGGLVDLEEVLDFVDAGHDLIFAADSSASHLIRNIAVEFGVDFDKDAAAVVIDHSAYAVVETERDHTLIASDDFLKSKVIMSEKKIEAPILFQGISHSLNAANSLVLKVLSASPSAYSADPKTKLLSPPTLTGSVISLASIISGAQKADSSIKYEKSGNEQFVDEISKWIFHERGHLKAINVSHHKFGETAGVPKAWIHNLIPFKADSSPVLQAQ